MQNWVRYAAVSCGLAGLLAVSIPGSGADAVPATAPAKATRANYELASRWTPAKVGKLVFDLAVTPHWLDSGDRFWYSFENNNGRKFYIVDPARKTKSPVFDPARLASALTMATGLPYDGQHLPITVIRFVRNESAIQFEVNVPIDAAIPGEKKPVAAATQTDGSQHSQTMMPTAAPGPAFRSSWVDAAPGCTRRLLRATRNSSPSSLSWPPRNCSCSTRRRGASQPGPTFPRMTRPWSSCAITTST